MEHDLTHRCPNPKSLDRRKRHQDDMSVLLTVSIPLSLRKRLDDVVVTQRSTLSGVLRQALIAWLEQQEDTLPR